MTRHLGLRARTKQRGEIGVIQDGESFAPNFVLLLGSEAVHWQCQKAPRRDLALLDRQLGQSLQQPVYEEAALEPVTPLRCQRRESGRLGPARPRRGERPRRVGLGRRWLVHPVRQWSGSPLRLLPGGPEPAGRFEGW